MNLITSHTFGKSRLRLRSLLSSTSLLLAPLFIGFGVTLPPTQSADLMSWASAHGGIVDPQRAQEWWRYGLSPLLHGSTSHLLGNTSLIILAILIGQIRLNQHPMRSALILYLSAIFITWMRVMLSVPLGITQGSIGISGGAFTLLCAVCAEVGYLQPRRRESLLWVSLPIMLCMANQGDQVDQWSHALGGMMGVVIGWRLGVSRG